ncbi:hypothetical protein BOW55_20640, partial [Flavobacterium sp. YO12]
MKIKNTFLGLTGLLLFSTVSYSQVGIGTLTPEQSSQLDVTATNKGMLIPRIKLVQTTLQTPVIGTAAVSLLVYNTQTINDVMPGFYYWNGVKWVRIVNKDEIDNFNETITTLLNNGNGTYTYSSEDGKKTTIDIGENVKTYQTLTSLNYNVSTQVLTYKDEDEKLHEITLAGLTGPRGLPGLNGIDGKDFKYEDFTPGQLAGLKGADGAAGKDGADGIDGKDFKYEDFTPGQLA